METMKSHFLASPAWEKWQKKLGYETFHVKRQGFEYLAIAETDRLNKRLYCPYSPMIKRADELGAALASVENLTLQIGGWFVRIEPQGEITAEQLISKGYRRVKNLQPNLTWVLDLTASEDELLANMKQANRNLHRNGHKKGLKFTITDNPEAITALTDLLAATAAHNQANLRSTDYVRRQAEVLLANQAAQIGQVWLDDQVIASALVYDSPTTRYYAFAAADYEHRKLGAGTYLVTNLIMDAKQRGMKEFDFYGITDSDDPNHPWQGFTRFKKSFGGQEKRYLGTWEKPLKPLRYHAYRLLLKAYRKLR